MQGSTASYSEIFKLHETITCHFLQPKWKNLKKKASLLNTLESHI